MIENHLRRRPELVAQGLPLGWHCAKQVFPYQHLSGYITAGAVVKLGGIDPIVAVLSDYDIDLTSWIGGWKQHMMGVYAARIADTARAHSSTGASPSGRGGLRRPTVADEIRRYVATGETDPHSTAWPRQATGVEARNGRSPWSVIAEGAQTRTVDDLRTSLLTETKSRAAGRSSIALSSDQSSARIRAKAAPMIHGLFPASRHAPLLTAVERSTVVLTCDALEQALVGGLMMRWDQAGWSLANAYLHSVGAELLAPDAEAMVCVSAETAEIGETTCFVSPTYFDGEGQGPFSDILVHEVSHLLHKGPAWWSGVEDSKNPTDPLEIPFVRRETFAFACEVYSRIVERSSDPSERHSLASEFDPRREFSELPVDPDELRSLVRAATAEEEVAGWQLILRSCT